MSRGISSPRYLGCPLHMNVDLIYSERSITSRAQDALGRAPFANYLAEVLSSWRNGRDSLVIGLMATGEAGNPRLRGWY